MMMIMMMMIMKAYCRNKFVGDMSDLSENCRTLFGAMFLFENLLTLPSDKLLELKTSIIGRIYIHHRHHITVL